MNDCGSTHDAKLSLVFATCAIKPVHAVISGTRMIGVLSACSESMSGTNPGRPCMKIASDHDNSRKMEKYVYRYPLNRESSCGSIGV